MVIQEIEEHLLASLARINRQAENLHRTFCLKGQDGQLLGGLTCSTAYGWLHIETLWVSHAYRIQGFGRQLMDAAETFGRNHGCHSAWLDTSNDGAQVFYKRLGYEVFGELGNGEDRPPAEHHRWFLQRRL
ncbi:MAG: GNAT family N-acetyltransferase [Geminicoccales bacterium]